MNNQDIYTNEEFEKMQLWAAENHLHSCEKYFLEKYLVNKNSKILEAGTGGGRLAFYIEKLGFTSVTAFDIVPRMIYAARKRSVKENSNVTFLVADASNLSNFQDESFDYLIYLQQVLCFIENEDDFNRALKETYRLCKKKGLVVFSFLDYDTRSINLILSFIVNLVRKLRKEHIRKQHLPWLKLQYKFNLKLLNKNQASCYWVKKNDILQRLQQLGFNVLEVQNQSTINKASALRKGWLYVVCEK